MGFQTILGAIGISFLTLISGKYESSNEVAGISKSMLECVNDDTCIDADPIALATNHDGVIPFTYCANSCLDNASPEETYTACGLNSSPVVWFAFNIDEDAAQIFIEVTPDDGSWSPTITIHGGENCNSLTLLNGCNVGNLHSAGVVSYTPAKGFGTIWVAVGAQDASTINASSFTICASAVINAFNCSTGDPPEYDPNCDQKAVIEVVRRSNDPNGVLGLPISGPYCPGEELRICFNIFYDASILGGESLHGIVPIFGTGLDLAAFDPNSLSHDGDGGLPTWFDENQTRFQRIIPNICTYINSDGNLTLCNKFCDPCPCATPMPQGTFLPGGWFWNNPAVGRRCDDTGLPEGSRGMGSPVSNIVNFCFDIKIKNFTSEVFCREQLNTQGFAIGFQTFSDGVTGCWDDPLGSCLLDVSQLDRQLIQVDCNIDGTAPDVSIAKDTFAYWESISFNIGSENVLINRSVPVGLSIKDTSFLVSGEAVFTDTEATQWSHYEDVTIDYTFYAGYSQCNPSIDYSIVKLRKIDTLNLLNCTLPSQGCTFLYKEFFHLDSAGAAYAVTPTDSVTITDEYIQFCNSSIRSYELEISYSSGKDTSIILHLNRSGSEDFGLVELCASDLVNYTGPSLDENMNADPNNDGFLGWQNPSYPFKEGINCVGTLNPLSNCFYDQCVEINVKPEPKIPDLRCDEEGFFSINVAWDRDPAVSFYNTYLDGALYEVTSDTHQLFINLPDGQSFIISVEGVSDFGCLGESGSTTCQTMRVVNNEEVNFHQITVDPNPASNFINIKDPDQLMQTCTVIKSTGQTVYSGIEHQINTKDWIDGVYFAILYTKEGHSTIRRFLIIH